MPLYPLVKTLDGVNFSNSTVWEGRISEGMSYRYDDKTGYQYISEGSSLPAIENDKYDFVLSCNNLEHIANPIKATLEWKRIIKPGGVILLILPNNKANFDHKKPFTDISHIIDDYKLNVSEKDLTHLEEILKLHNLSRDPQAGSFINFKERCANNYLNRCIHHHVFSQKLLKSLFEFCAMDTLLQYTSSTDHYIAARKRDNQ